MREKEHENDIRCYGVRKMKDIIEINGFIYEKRKEEITKKIFIKSRYDETKILFESDKKTMKEVLEDANLKDANLEGANLEGANLKGANLKGANLEGANLKGANLEYANLKGANLKGANLKGANLEYANLEYANLKDAKVLLCTVNFSKTEIKQAEQFIINLKKEANND